MSTTIILGNWVIPSVLTIIVFFIAYLYSMKNVTTRGYMNLSGIWYLIAYGTSAILSLIFWLIWALMI